MSIPVSLVKVIRISCSPMVSRTMELISRRVSGSSGTLYLVSFTKREALGFPFRYLRYHCSSSIEE